MPTRSPPCSTRTTAACSSSSTGSTGWRRPSATRSTSSRATPPCRAVARSVASTSPTSRPARPSTSRHCVAPCSTSSSTSASAPRRSGSGTPFCSTTPTAARSTSRRASGHCFVALTDDATVSYLVTDVYTPGREHGINPLDPEIALDFPVPADELAALGQGHRTRRGLAEARRDRPAPDLGCGTRLLRLPRPEVRTTPHSCAESSSPAVPAPGCGRSPRASRSSSCPSTTSRWSTTRCRR